MKSFLKKIIVLKLRLEARVALFRFRPKIVAVVGSVGKTSTKDAIAAVLSSSFPTRKSEKSFNSEIGVPLTILGLPNAWDDPFLWATNIYRGAFRALFEKNYPEWLVLEIGVDRPGDMRKMCEWIKPDIVVVTRFAETPVHVEFFGTPEAVFEEKALILGALKKGGLLILNADDEKVLQLKEKGNFNVKTFGFGEGADCRMSNGTLLYALDESEVKTPEGISFNIQMEGEKTVMEVHGTLGETAAYAVAPAFIVGRSANISSPDIVKALSEFSPPPGRLRILPGIKKTLILDDSYNSSPVAALSALYTLHNVPGGGRKIAMLGDMLELGKYTEAEHRKLGVEAARICDMLFTVGTRAQFIAEEARQKGMDAKKVFEFKDSREAGKALELYLKEGDIVLVKGSQGSGENAIRMERAVLEIMLHPEDKEKFLVRQDEEWEKR